MAGLPPGFTIDQPQGDAGPRSSLPPGFTIDQPGSDAPDISDMAPSAITWGQQQFSPGLPAVNQEVDRIAKSANRNLIEPITHPLETLSGIANVAAGLGQYATQGAFGTGYEPNVDALAKDYAKTYGSLAGFKDALVNDPVRVGMDVSGGLGLLRGIGRRAGVLSRPAAPVAAPTLEELRDAAQTNYANMKGYGVELHSQVMENVHANIKTELHDEGYRDYLVPKTFRAVDELLSPVGNNHTIQDIDGVRRALNKAAADPVERDAARRAIAQIDSTMANLQPADVAVNPQFAPLVAQQANEARANYASYKQAQQIEGATDAASLQAASTGSGANIDNATRQKFRAILTNPKKARGYTDAEKAAMRQIVQGTFTGNAARLLGKLAPSGVVSAGLSVGLGEAAGHAVGVPVVGYMAKQLADNATARAAARLSEQRRLRSPLAQQLGAQPSPGWTPPVGAALQAARLGNMSQQYPNPYP